MTIKGLNKRIINAAEHLFLKEDAESAFSEICIAIDALASRIYYRKGRKSYMLFIKDRMDIITLIAFRGVCIRNLYVAVKPFDDGTGKIISADKIDENGVSLYSFEQIVYYLIRCKQIHTAEIADCLIDTGINGNGIKLDNGIFSFSFYNFAFGLLIALISEIEMTDVFHNTVFEKRAINGIQLSHLFGKKQKAIEILTNEVNNKRVI